jgi:hypothetical protein
MEQKNMKDEFVSFLMGKGRCAETLRLGCNRSVQI